MLSSEESSSMLSPTSVSSSSEAGIRSAYDAASDMAAKEAATRVVICVLSGLNAEESTNTATAGANA